ncbi:hypothetical protein GBF38_017458 [Nibea albiflora]|uniref:Uncharacterized protein n=1 Tax=Nibea albiflora TaxID=240163 RepID=A0ACB7F4D4_NIBAL|nr:hypothetical protein GBF38_017458 [Nibea albiflora]
MKSLQFRSIAPKAPAVVPSPSPAVLSCQPPSALPEATTASSPKSIIVPTQNYCIDANSWSGWHFLSGGTAPFCFLSDTTATTATNPVNSKEPQVAHSQIPAS